MSHGREHQTRGPLHGTTPHARGRTLHGWPDDALRLMRGEFRTLAGGADWQRAWLAAFLATCKTGPLRDELRTSLAP